MTKIASVVLMVAACLSPVSGQAQKPTAAEAVKQVERDWMEAEKSADVGKLGEIVGNDWVGIGPTGVKATKQQLLADVKAGALKVESVEFAPMEVKVLGTIAVVQGGDTEKSSYKGKDMSGKWVWMDVFALRNGKWQAVRSQTVLLK